MGEPSLFWIHTQSPPLILDSVQLFCTVLVFTGGDTPTHETDTRTSRTNIKAHRAPTRADAHRLSRVSCVYAPYHATPDRGQKYRRSVPVCPGRVRRRSAEVALVSARIRETQGGGVSPSWGWQARDGSRACIHRWCGIAAAAPAPAVDSGSDRRECRASERGGPAEGRARSAPARRVVGAPRVPGPKGGAQQPPIGCLPARPQPERLLREY